jgi:hypothetical protein
MLKSGRRGGTRESERSAICKTNGYSISIASVRKNAPARGDVDGLSNAQGWIYINASENTQAALLDHLELNPVSSFQTATGCPFELCNTDQRAKRRLIMELHPVLIESSKPKLILSPSRLNYVRAKNTCRSN